MAAMVALSCSSVPTGIVSVRWPLKKPVTQLSCSSVRSCGFFSHPLTLRCPSSRTRVVIRAMAEPVKKKMDSAVKRARIAEARRIYNKSRKTEIKTRMKKVFAALEQLKKSSSASPDDIKPIEELIAKAYSIIDKAVKVGTLHRNTGGNRKSRLARAKKALEIKMGWYTPAAP